MTRIDTLIRDAFDGDLQARRELYLRTQLVPELEDVLGEVFETRPVIFMEVEQLEHDELDTTVDAMQWALVERTVAKVVIAASETSTPVIDVSDKLAATLELREGLEAMVAWLDARIDSFHDQLDQAEAASA